jgi:hypothetical protein
MRAQGVSMFDDSGQRTGMRPVPPVAMPPAAQAEWAVPGNSATGNSADMTEHLAGGVVHV